MAYVAISGELIKRVSHKIANMRTKELKTIGEKPCNKFDENSPYFLSLVWGEDLHLKDTLPKRFMSKTDSFGVIYKNPNYREWIYFQNPLVTPPYCSSAIDGIDWEHPELVELKKWLDTQDEIEQRWRKTTKDVTGFLEKCKSLNEAVKLWPDVEAYIDGFDMSRVNAKKEKTEKVNEAMEALKSLDTDTLTANAVIARISGE